MVSFMREEREQAKAERAEMEACAEAKLEAVWQESEAEKSELRSEVEKCRQEVSTSVIALCSPAGDVYK
jgi:polyhydroxyalkanoate synthesis regulator phasin